MYQHSIWLLHSFRSDCLSPPITTEDHEQNEQQWIIYRGITASTSKSNQIASHKIEKHLGHEHWSSTIYSISSFTTHHKSRASDIRRDPDVREWSISHRFIRIFNSFEHPTFLSITIFHIVSKSNKYHYSLIWVTNSYADWYQYIALRWDNASNVNVVQKYLIGQSRSLEDEKMTLSRHTLIIWKSNNCRDILF